VLGRLVGWRPALRSYADQLSDAGRHTEALDATARVVRLHDLAATDPAVYEPRLAAALNTLGIRLSNLGRHADAADATGRSVEVWTRLAARDPAYEPQLAIAQNNHQIDLSHAGRRYRARKAREAEVHDAPSTDTAARPHRPRWPWS